MFMNVSLYNPFASFSVGGLSSFQKASELLTSKSNYKGHVFHKKKGPKLKVHLKKIFDNLLEKPRQKLKKRKLEKLKAKEREKLETFARVEKALVALNHLASKPLKEIKVSKEAKASNALKKSTPSKIAFQPLKKEENELLQEIFDFVGQASLWTLSTAKKKFEGYKQQLSQMHPLSILVASIQNNALFDSLSVIQARGNPVWSKFVELIYIELAEQHAKNNVMPYITKAAQAMNISGDELKHYVEDRQLDLMLVKFKAIKEFKKDPS